MRDPIPDTVRLLRKRFGSSLKDRRVDLGMTQADVGHRLGIGANMVSQVERGITALPMHDLERWADVLGIRRSAFAQTFAYYNLPDFHRCMSGEDPYEIEELPRPTPTTNSAPGRPAARSEK